MKALFRILLLTVSLVLLFSLFACTPKSPDEGENEGEQGTNETIDRTKPSAGQYKIRFYLAARDVIHYYNAGETITPPDTLPTYETKECNFVFDGWDGVEFKVVDGDAVYHANYRVEYNYYTATFVVGEQSIEVQTVVGYVPKAPAITEFTLRDGEQFVAWDTTLTVFSEDTTISAITTKYFTPQYFLAAYQSSLLEYPESATTKDNSGDTVGEALALTTLLIEENQNPQGGAVAARIVEHLTAFVSPDKAPSFDACCLWSYAPHSGSIAIAKATPTVWNIVPADIKLRLDTMMRAFAILESFATSDYNNYGTGPSMLGNYGKGWNPNYRLANVPVMVYATHYFGDGDMDKGAEFVNGFLKGFDEAAYDDIIATFRKYGWRRAALCWTSDARTSTDGKNIKGESAKTLMLYGGQAVGEDTPTDSYLLVALGTGCGVANKDARGNPRDYLYNGYALNEADGIIRSLLMHNYGTGDLTKSNPQKSTFLEVKSDHWYDKDGDGQKELVAWITTGLPSPYEGQYGMMKEFASGNRSSTGYCSHDFVLTTSMIYTCKILGIYDLATDTYTDNNGVNIREAIIVGNEDFLFKNEQGYKGYATGSYGESDKEHSERNEGSRGYFTMKSLWRNIMKPELEAAIGE